MQSYGSPRVIVALDFSDMKSAQQLVAQLTPEQCRLKIGKELFTRYGSQCVNAFVGQGFSVFLDLKFHDIPNTVAGACRAAADLGVWMINIHAMGGRIMMEAAVQALASYGADKPLLTAVTLLTSIDTTLLHEIGFTDSCEQTVLRLSKYAREAGVDGVVCSAHEASMLRTACGSDFCLVTPGIRLASSPLDDQKRIMTPTQAIAAGANYLVIGRPITQASQPQQVLEQINIDIEH